MTNYNDNKQLITDAGNDLLLQHDHIEPKFTTYVKLNDEAREWDARFFNKDPWESLAVRDKDKDGKPFMRAVHPSETAAVDGRFQWFKPEGFVTKDGRPLTGMLHRPQDGKHPEGFYHRYDANTQEIQWAKDNSFEVHVPKPSNEIDDKGWYHDELTGTGSKDAPESPIWGYQLYPSTPHTQPNIEEYVAPDCSDISFSEAFVVDSGYTPCVPSADDVTIHLEPSIACQVFGARHAKQPRKYQYKAAALNRSLNEVFKSRDYRPSEKFDSPFSLDTCPVNGEESHWIPVTEDGMEKLIAVDEYHRRRQQAALQLESIRKAIGEDKYLLLVLSAQGKTNKEISDELRANGKDVSKSAVEKSLQRIRKSIHTLKGGN